MKLDFYFLFGFIDNYAGGYSSKDNIIQRMNVSDKNKVKLLIKRGGDLLNSFNLKNDLEAAEENGLLIIYSPNLIQKLDEIYTDKTYFFGRDYFNISDNIFEVVKSWNPNDIGMLQRKAFLEGAYARHGAKNEIRIYNDLGKTLTLYRAMHSIADEDDEISISSFFLTPHSNLIKVNYQGEIWKKVLKKMA